MRAGIYYTFMYRGKSGHRENSVRDNFSGLEIYFKIQDTTSATETILINLLMKGEKAF